MGNILEVFEVCCLNKPQKMSNMDFLKLEMWYRKRYKEEGVPPTFGEVLVEEQKILQRKSF